MGFGTPPTVLEGDYSTWTQKDYSPIADAEIASSKQVAFIHEDKEIAYVFVTAGKLKTIDLTTGDLTVLLSNVGPSDATDLLVSLFSSVLGRYHANVDLSVTPEILKVYRNGALLFSFTIPDDAVHNSVAISPSGKWLILVDGEFKKYYVFEGS